MTTTLHHRTRSVCRAAFITTLLVFLALATTLVLTQIVGALLLQPSWITWASETLVTPSITAAIVFGITGFINGYLVPGKMGRDQ